MTSTPTYEVAQREDGSWGVKCSDGETIFGSFETEGHAQAAADGATWATERMAAGQ